MLVLQLQSAQHTENYIYLVINKLISYSKPNEIGKYQSQSGITWLHSDTEGEMKF